MRKTEILLKILFTVALVIPVINMQDVIALSSIDTEDQANLVSGTEIYGEIIPEPNLRIASNTVVITAKVDWQPREIPKDLVNKKHYITTNLKIMGKDQNYIDIATCIIDKESGGTFLPETHPQTCVQHCGRGDGSWYAKELMKYPDGRMWQYECKTGEVIGKCEQTNGYGILESTWKGHTCKGDFDNWYDSLVCFEKIQRESGWSQWVTYSQCK